MIEVPDYSRVASEYAPSRPVYPPELSVWLASTVTDRSAAWDAAAGNGQAAIGLAAHFTRVVARDLSPGQVRELVTRTT